MSGYHWRIPLEEEKKKVPSREVLMRLLRYLLPYKTDMIIALTSITVASITGIAAPYILGKEIISRYILRGDVEGLLWISVILIIILLVNFFANSIRTYSIRKIGQKMLLHIRSDLFKHLQKIPISFYEQARSGDIISRVTNDTDSIGEAFTSGVASIISDMLSLVMIVAVMIKINAELALASMTVIPILVLLALTFNSKFKAAYRATRMRISGVTTKLEESISGIREIKSFTREKNTIEEFRNINLANLQANLQATKIWGAFFPIIRMTQALGSGIVIIYGGMLALNGSLGTVEEAVGVLVTFLIYVRMFFGPVFDITNFYNTIQSALAAAERIFELLDVKPEISDAKGIADIPRIEGEITFKNVTFGYNLNHPVLHNISFRIKPKEAVAIVGPTGAGKTTIIKLLIRFYDPQSGKIMIDGHDIKHIKQRMLRRHIGIVPQDTFLFSGTIMDNIRYGRLDATEDEVIAAAKAVGAHKFIENLPDGYYTRLGERGTGLSVGQRQLISFARALLRNPAILILDEATSSVDPYTELLIKRAMKTLLKNRTAIIIAHRFSTLRDVNRILVMDNGRIIEEGTHQELMRKKGLYYHLYKMQFRDIDRDAVQTVKNR